MQRSADYIVVGAGSAGCVIANRLTENPSTRVILLEAGGDDRRFWVDMPGGMRLLLGDRRVDWLYQTAPDPSLDNRVVAWPRGKVLGGSSAINGLVYIRGDRADYDGWAAAGCTGWSFDDVLPYFLKSEGFEGPPPSPAHGLLGPLSVSRQRSPHPLGATFLRACSQMQVPQLDDYCSGDQDGAFWVLTNQRRGRRSSAAEAFLRPAMSRPNLEVVSGCEVERVLFEGDRAVGVRVARGRARFDVTANAEVVLSAGSIASPSILMRSGIGDGVELQALGVPLRANRPGVGKNLQEHACVASGGREVNVPTFNTQASPIQLVGHLVNYLMFGKGLLTSTATIAMANIRTSPDLEHPDVTLHFVPLAFVSGAPARAGALPPFHPKPAVRIVASVYRPHSRGEIRLGGAALEDRPVIDHRLLGDPRDVDSLIRGVKFVEKLFDTPAFKPFVVGRLPPPPPSGDEGLDVYVRRTAGVCYHPVGTCRMGVGLDAVVDPHLRVQGVRGLRVADASIMPALVSTNTNAPAMMIGEKAAHLLRQ